MEPAAREKLLEAIRNDLKAISLETKRSKSFQPVRESTDEAIARIRVNGSETGHTSGCGNMFLVANQILYPLVQGCETKDAKLVRMCLALMQRLVTNKVIDFKGARYITDTLWMLMESGIEEVKILQTLTLILTSSHVVQNETLARCLVICFRLHFTRDSTVNTIAGATIRQLVPVVLERVSLVSNPQDTKSDLWIRTYEEPSPKMTNLMRGANFDPANTNPFVVDAYLMFQDIVLLVGADQPVWMTGIVEMTRTFGLELLESMLTQFPSVFIQHMPFRALLKEKVCSLVIKLFSPNIKYNIRGSAATNSGQSNYHSQGPSTDKPNYSITSKLLRVVAVLILEYHDALTTESEIFLSLIMKFLDPDKPSWQNGSALEVIHKIMVRPNLLKFICTHFDMNEHSTRVFRDMINGLGAFVQNVLLACPLADSTVSESTPPLSSSQMGTSTSTAMSASSGGSNAVAYGPGLSPQPGFSYRNVWKPLTISFIGGQTKEIYLDVSDRGEIPVVSDGYCISLAYVSLLDCVRSLSLLIDQPENSQVNEGTVEPIDQKCIQTLLESSWCGLLSAMSLLLDASTDDASTENILKHLETYASFCGKINLTRPRDAYLAAICKASLPPHYTLNVLKATPSTQNVSGPLKGQGDSNTLASAGGESDIRHQVVAVGTPLPTSSLPSSAHQGPVMLTAKNLQCMRAILSVAHCHGNLLGASWHIILTTLQHLVWILGLKPVTGGALTASAAGNSSSENSSVITTAVMADLPVLSNMVTRLFESSSHLSTTSVKYLIEALCHLSEESMELASANREPSLFAVAKLLETALVNLDRVDVVWRPITNHLLVVSQHPHLRMRQWGCEALTFLTRQGLQHRIEAKDDEGRNVSAKKISSSSVGSTDDQDLSGSEARRQTMLLSPLAELSAIPFPDVRQKQLDTVLHILHASGEILNHGWPLILTMIGALESDHSDILIRSAFQCLQLVFTDFLHTIPYRCYPICVDTATKFGSQKAELNVSLTAIGLLWNLSDYFYQNVNQSNVSDQKNEDDDKVSSARSSDKKTEITSQNVNTRQLQQIFPEAFLSFPGSKNISSFDKLWMCLYCRLKDLCLDTRPSVRKSSGQTLFSTIAAHGSILEASTWQAVLWQVLFPLLDNVIIQSDNASSEKVSQSNVIMIHHSRNTAQKQWAETKVLTISGVVRVFNTKRNLLKSMGDYSKAWVLLLEYVEKMALSNTSEVSLAALKALQEMITSSSTGMPSANSPGKNEKSQSNVSDLKDINWTLCWKAWLNIGNQKANYISNTSEIVPHSQMLLAGYLQIFLTLFPHVRNTFRREDVESLGKVLLSCAQVPLESEFQEAAGNTISQLHGAILESLNVVREVSLKGDGQGNNWLLLPEVFEVYFKLCKAAMATRSSYKDLKFREKFSLLGEACLDHIALTYENAVTSEKDPRRHETLNQILIKENIHFKAIRLLHIPLRQKYKCYVQSNWRVAINVLIKILRCGIPIARLNTGKDDVSQFSDFWAELGEVLECFLFPECTEDQRQEDKMADEAVDCHIVELLREEVLPFPNQVPTAFIRKIVVLLNKGSIHSSMTLSDDCSGTVGLREDFAKLCFETLLEFSLLDSEEISSTKLGYESSASVTNRMAITSLLQRFKEVLQDAIDGEKLNQNIPLQRQKTAEISFVLKAIGTVISSMKRASVLKQVEKKTWNQIIGLYPYLVQFTNTSSPQISSSVKDALLEYHDLLQPYGAD